MMGVGTSTTSNLERTPNIMEAFPNDSPYIVALLESLPMTSIALRAVSARVRRRGFPWDDLKRCQ